MKKKYFNQIIQPTDLTEYVDIPAPDYINGLEFDYIETWYFLKGDLYEQWVKDHPGHYSSYIFDDELQIHPTAQKTGTFLAGSAEVLKIKESLKTVDTVKAVSACAPIYREAILFFDKDKNLVSALNICLSCEYMSLNNSQHIDASNTCYEQLREFFISIGHEIVY